MTRLTFLGVAAATLALPLSVSAQSPKYALPDGFLNTGGNYSNGNGVLYVFDRPYLHYQEVHTTWGGKGNKMLTGAAFRRGWGQANAPAAVARIADVTFTAGHGSIATFSRTSFAGNYTGASATVVHPKATVALPSRQMKPTTIPAPWDVFVPFKTPFLYDGTSDFVWEILYENPSVTATTSYNSDRASTTAYLRTTGESQFTGCTTTGNTSPFDMISRFDNYGPNGATYKMRLYTSTADAPANTAVTLALGVQKADAQIPGWCAKVYPNPIAFLPLGTANASGNTTGIYFDFPHFAAAEHATLYLQAYALDASHPGGILLSDGQDLLIPPAPPFPLATGTTKYIYQTSPATVTPSGPFTAGSVITGWY